MTRLLKMPFEKLTGAKILSADELRDTLGSIRRASAKEHTGAAVDQIRDSHEALRAKLAAAEAETEAVRQDMRDVVGSLVESENRLRAELAQAKRHEELATKQSIEWSMIAGEAEAESRRLSQRCADLEQLHKTAVYYQQQALGWWRSREAEAARLSRELTELEDKWGEERAELNKRDIKAVLAKYRCGDTACIFGCNGMGTNGGCRCTAYFRVSLVRFAEFVREIREVLR